MSTETKAVKEEKERQAYVAKKTGAFRAVPGVEAKDTNGAAAHAPIVINLPPEVEKAIEEVGGKNSLDNVRSLITRECRNLEALLHEKNAGYGNSALDPVRIFSKASPVEQIYVRLDDKLSRIMRGDLSKGDADGLRQTVADIQGYLILLQVAWRLGLK